MMKRIRNMFLACGVVAMGLPAVSALASETPVKMASETPVKAHNFAYAVQSDFNVTVKKRDFSNLSQYAQQQSRPSVSPSQAKSIALRRNPGARFIDVQLRGNQYRVRLQLKNGRIKDVYVDARRR